jgi:hypothetical protein
MASLLQPPPTAHEATRYLVPAWIAGATLSLATETFLLELNVPLEERGGVLGWDLTQLPEPIRQLLVLLAENPSD